MDPFTIFRVERFLKFRPSNMCRREDCPGNAAPETNDRRNWKTCELDYMLPVNCTKLS